jgi:hypothetical protein
LDEDTVDDIVRPRLDAYRAFKGDFRERITGIEKRLWHPTLNYAGIIDRTITGHTCYSLHLKPGQRVPYKLIEVPNIRAQLNVFVSALNVMRWRESNLKGEQNG